MQPFLISNLITHTNSVFMQKNCIFLGYNLFHKRYKCLTPNGKFFISQCVRLNEEFPCLHDSNFHHLVTATDTSPANNTNSSISNIIPVFHLPSPCLTIPTSNPLSKPLVPPTTQSPFDPHRLVHGNSSFSSSSSSSFVSHS